MRFLWIRTSALLLSSLLLWTLAASPALAQSRPGTVVIQVDLMALERSDTIDGTETRSALGASHEFLKPQRFQVAGRVKFGGAYSARDSLVLQVPTHRAIGDVECHFQVGELLSLSRGESNVIKTLRPIEDLDLTARWQAIEPQVTAMKPEAVHSGLASLGISQRGKIEELRKRLISALRLSALKTFEDRCLELKLIKERELVVRDLAPGVDPSVVEAQGRALIERSARGLSWSLEIRYHLLFRRLGNSSGDLPSAAFVPGKLSEGVGTILVKSPIIEGLERVLWYRLPGFDDDAHEIVDINAPAGWMMRIFKSSEEVGGALIFISVPMKGSGELRFSWCRKDRGGSRVEVHRPPARSSPY